MEDYNTQNPIHEEEAQMAQVFRQRERGELPPTLENEKVHEESDDEESFRR